MTEIDQTLIHYLTQEEELIVPENESEVEYLTSEEREQLDNFEIERRVSEMDYPIGNKRSESNIMD